MFMNMSMPKACLKEKYSVMVATANNCNSRKASIPYLSTQISYRSSRMLNMAQEQVQPEWQS